MSSTQGPISTPLFHNNGLPAEIIAQGRLLLLITINVRMTWRTTGRPMARIGSADEMNGIVEYLLAPSASYTTVRLDPFRTTRNFKLCASNREQYSTSTAAPLKKF